MALQSPEPRNPFYFLLLLAGLAFALTATACAVVPVLVEKARDAGGDVPESPFLDALTRDGWKWVLYELAAVVVFGLASMALDRFRHLKSEPPQATIPDTKDPPPQT